MNPSNPQDQNPSMNGASPGRQWAMATSRHEGNGRAIIFRYIQDFVNGFNKQSQPIRIIVAWSYDSETGMPATEERQRMDAMEDALALTVEKDGFASLVLVSTGEGLREWTYYARSKDEFMSRLNLGLANHPRFPIDIHISADPKWAMYDEFRRNVVE